MARVKDPMHGSNLRILISLILATLAWPLSAANIYKYQDENGLWHFTDRAPDAEVDFEIVYMEREPEPRLRMRKEGDGANPVYVLANDLWGPVEVEMKFEESVNVLTEPVLPARFVIPARSESPVLGIGALDPAQGFRYRLSMVSVPGRPIGKPVTGLVIPPPIAPGESYPVNQGFKGGKTHNSPESEFAVDIGMPTGTSVHAVRSGIVMDVEEDFNRGGTDWKKYGDKVNHVRILHDDGTMAVYAHLDLASVLVRPGARVRAGQRIARSGNTGFSSGPHLHFAIQQNTGMRLISLPFKFRAQDGPARSPEQGQIVAGLDPLR